MERKSKGEEKGESNEDGNEELEIVHGEPKHHRREREARTERFAASPRASGPVISAPNKALSTTETATTITKMNIYCFLQKLIRRIGRNRGLCSLIFGLWS